MKSYYLIFVLAFISGISCQQKTIDDSKEELPANKQPNTFAQKVEASHHKEAFVAKELIQYDLKLWFGGSMRMDATITMSPDFSRIRMEYENGRTLIYNGDGVYQVGDTTSYKSARFDIFTWPYFFAFPFKLSDPGTNWESSPYSTLGEKPYISQKLTFDNGVGDAPDDWYIAYADTETYRLYAAAYIVTMGRTQDQAEEDPHAISYTDYQEFEGVPIATKWQFWNWRWEKGLEDQLGNAVISNIAFLPMDNTLFELTTPMRKIEK